MGIDLQELRGYISDMYRDVASYPRAEFHFPTGRPLMEQLGYPTEILDRVPSGAMESFAGVGYHFGLDPLREGERVLDIGSGSGSDALFAGIQVGESGRVTGIDMTDKMLTKSRQNAVDSGLTNTVFEEGYAEQISGENEYDCVISNGVINLSPDKASVFSAIFRALKPGGRLMFSDIVTGIELPESVRDNCELWAECIGGAQQQDRYVRMIEDAGMRVEKTEPNDSYAFTQTSTIEAATRFQVSSVRILAYKP